MKNSDSKISIPILAFHKVDPKFEWGVTRATPDRFRKIMQYLYNAGYQTLSLSDLTAGRFDSDKKKYICITFDDSYASLYEYALPIMQSFGFSGTIFVITDYVGIKNTWDVNLGWLTFQHLSWSQIQEMQQAGFEFGSHTATHPDLTRISSDQAKSEITDSKHCLEDKTGRPADFISYPFGRYNRAIIDLTKEAGYINACAFWNTIQKVKEPFVLERKAYYLLDTMFTLRAKLHNNVWTRIEDIKLRLINFCSHGTSLVKHKRW